MNEALHPRSNVARIYLPRTEGGRGLISVEECVRSEEHGISDYTKRITNDERLRSCLESGLKETTKQEYRNSLKDMRTSEWKDKPLHGQFPKRVDEIPPAKELWNWLKLGTLKKETEGMIFAAQDQALPTRNRKYRIEKTGESPMCRMCMEREKTTMHILSECPKLAQSEYKKRHDKVGTMIHWRLCQKHGLEHTTNWYDHRAPPVIENAEVKIL
jgi:hypothetical protein